MALTAAKLATYIQRAAQDAAFTRAAILDLLNEGQEQIAAGIPLPPEKRVISSPLQGLKDTDTVDTGTAAYVALPDDYQRGLFFVASSDQDKRIKVYESYTEFLAQYPNLDETGTYVDAVCVKGNSLYYQPIPSSAETLTLHFYRVPTDMAYSGDNTTPDGIPDHLQKKLLVNYALTEIFAADPQAAAVFQARLDAAILEMESCNGTDGEAYNVEPEWDEYI